MSNFVETYEFKLDVMTFRYTSDEVLYVAENKTYYPLSGLSRSAYGISTTAESREFSVQIPANSSIAGRVAMFATPPRTVLTFRRYQRSWPYSPVQKFEAVLVGASISGEVCTLKFPDSFKNAVEGMVPKTITQPGCNWTFGDGNCKKSPSSYKVVLPPSKVSYIGRNNVGDPVYQIGSWGAPAPIGWYRRGTLHLNAASQSEVRSIYYLEPAKTFGVGNSACKVVVTEPFTLDPTGGMYELWPGCSKVLSFSNNPTYESSCAGYSNTDRFGGFPWMPTEKSNPFEKPIKV